VRTVSTALAPLAARAAAASRGAIVRAGGAALAGLDAPAAAAAGGRRL
jgi:hypothetical protein